MAAIEIIKKQILWLLLLIPISFKIELFPGVIVMIQELVLPFLIFLYIIVFKSKIKLYKYQLPYLFLLLGFLILLFSTFLSLFRVFDIIGFLKLFKYIIYAIALLIISESIGDKTLNRVNNIAIITISLTLFIYVYNKFNSSMDWGEYMKISTWRTEYMPTGFSNRVLTLNSFEFNTGSNNHGIYGSYLALIFFLNLSNFIKSSERRMKSIIMLLLCSLNILLLTSRETFLLILITFLFFSGVKFLKNKIKLRVFFNFFIVATLFITLLVLLINKYNIELSIISKVQNMIEGIQERGGDGSMNMRFTTWKMILYLLLSQPLFLLLGTGFNPTYFKNSLDDLSILFQGKYVSVPENLFLMFMSYGGVFALMSILLFFYFLYYNFNKYSFLNEGMFLAAFIVGLFITNNTGGSMIAELFFTQLGLIYFYFINKVRLS